MEDLNDAVRHSEHSRNQNERGTGMSMRPRRSLHSGMTPRATDHGLTNMQRRGGNKNRQLASRSKRNDQTRSDQNMSVRSGGRRRVQSENNQNMTCPGKETTSPTPSISSPPSSSTSKGKLYMSDSSRNPASVSSYTLSDHTISSESSPRSRSSSTVTTSSTPSPRLQENLFISPSSSTSRPSLPTYVDQSNHVTREATTTYREDVFDTHQRWRSTEKLDIAVTGNRRKSNSELSSYSLAGGDENYTTESMCRFKEEFIKDAEIINDSSNCDETLCGHPFILQQEDESSSLLCVNNNNTIIINNSNNNNDNDSIGKCNSELGKNSCVDVSEIRLKDHSKPREKLKSSSSDGSSCEKVDKKKQNGENAMQCQSHQKSSDSINENCFNVPNSTELEPPVLAKSAWLDSPINSVKNDEPHHLTTQNVETDRVDENKSETPGKHCANIERRAALAAVVHSPAPSNSGRPHPLVKSKSSWRVHAARARESVANLISLVKFKDKDGTPTDLPVGSHQAAGKFLPRNKSSPCLMDTISSRENGIACAHEYHYSSSVDTLCPRPMENGQTSQGGDVNLNSDNGIQNNSIVQSYDNFQPEACHENVNNSCQQQSEMYVQSDNIDAEREATTGSLSNLCDKSEVILSTPTESISGHVKDDKQMHIGTEIISVDSGTCADIHQDTEHETSGERIDMLLSPSDSNVIRDEVPRASTPEMHDSQTGQETLTHESESISATNAILSRDVHNDSLESQEKSLDTSNESASVSNDTEDENKEVNDKNSRRLSSPSLLKTLNAARQRLRYLSDSPENHKGKITGEKHIQQGIPEECAESYDVEKETEIVKNSFEDSNEKVLENSENDCIESGQEMKSDNTDTYKNLTDKTDNTEKLKNFITNDDVITSETSDVEYDCRKQPSEFNVESEKSKNTVSKFATRQESTSLRSKSRRGSTSSVTSVKSGKSGGRRESSRRVENLLNNQLFKKHLCKHADVIERKVFGVHNRSMKKSLSNFDLSSSQSAFVGNMVQNMMQDDDFLDNKSNDSEDDTDESDNDSDSDRSLEKNKREQNKYEHLHRIPKRKLMRCKSWYASCSSVVLRQNDAFQNKENIRNIETEKQNIITSSDKYLPEENETNQSESVENQNTSPLSNKDEDIILPSKAPSKLSLNDIRASSPYHFRSKRVHIPSFSEYRQRKNFGGKNNVDDVTDDTAPIHSNDMYVIEEQENEGRQTSKDCVDSQCNKSKDADIIKHASTTDAAIQHQKPSLVSSEKNMSALFAHPAIVVTSEDYLGLEVKGRQSSTRWSRQKRDQDRKAKSLDDGSSTVGAESVTDDTDSRQSGSNQIKKQQCLHQELELIHTTLEAQPSDQHSDDGDSNSIQISSPRKTRHTSVKHYNNPCSSIQKDESKSGVMEQTTDQEIHHNSKVYTMEASLGFIFQNKEESAFHIDSLTPSTSRSPSPSPYSSPCPSPTPSPLTPKQFHYSSNSNNNRVNQNELDEDLSVRNDRPVNKRHLDLNTTPSYIPGSPAEPVSVDLLELSDASAGVDDEEIMSCTDEIKKSDEANALLRRSPASSASDSDLSNKTSVLRSTSDVSPMSSDDKEKRRRERKERPYKSDPFTGNTNKSPTYLSPDTNFRESLSVSTSCSFHSLEELAEQSDSNSMYEDDDEETRKKANRLSTASSASEDSGVASTLGKGEKQNEPQCPSCTAYINDTGPEGSSRATTPTSHPPEGSEFESLASIPLSAICSKCVMRRRERKETIQEIAETEKRYGRDLAILKEEFFRPIKATSLLTIDQLDAIFLNLDDLINVHKKLMDRLTSALVSAVREGDEGLGLVEVGAVFLESSSMFQVFEKYCVHQAESNAVLEQMEKEKELLRLFLQVAQNENPKLRRMHLKSFLMSPVQRVMKYPLLLGRLYKSTPCHHTDKDNIRHALDKIEDILEHINVQTQTAMRPKSRSQSGPVYSVSDRIEVNKVALEVLGWPKKEVCDIITSRLWYGQVPDVTWASKRARNVKFSLVHAALISHGRPKDDCPRTPRDVNPVKQVALVLVRDKGGKYTLVRDPFLMDRCVVTVDSSYDHVFELHEQGKDTYLFKADHSKQTRAWSHQLQQLSKNLGYWRRRRNGLANVLLKTS